MNKWVGLIGMSISLMVFSAGSTEIPGEVSKIVDGDTMWVTSANPTKTIKVRMIGLDAAESHFEDASGNIVAQQPWGDRGHHALEKITAIGRKVVLVSYGLDKYKRVLGRVLLDHKDVSEEMLEQGMATPYILCAKNCPADQIESGYVTAYRKACHKAFSAQKGVYSQNEPLLEMPFAFRARMRGESLRRYVGDSVTKKLFDPDKFEQIHVCDRTFFDTTDDANRFGYQN